MKLRKEVGIGEPISLDKAIKYVIGSLDGFESNCYAVKFLYRISKHLFFCIIFNNQNYSLSYQLLYSE